jgi:hypothetical protein
MEPRAHNDGMAEDAEPDAESVDAERHETPLQRLDRNWVDLLQELRVVQTGVQILTGFLVVLPFQSRFEQLTQVQTTIYLVTLCLAVLAMGFLIAPVSLHRTLFRRHARQVTVDVAHRLAQVGIVLLGAAVVGVVWLIFDLVLGTLAGAIAGGCAAVVLFVLWGALPLVIRERAPDPADGSAA